MTRSVIPPYGGANGLKSCTLALLFTFILLACGKGSSSGPSTNCGLSDCSATARITTTSITAYAGQVFELNGSLSQPSDLLSYRWEQLGGPKVSLSHADQPVAEFVTPIFESEEILSFRLVVSTSNSDSAANLNVVVKPFKVTAKASSSIAQVGIPVKLDALVEDDSDDLLYQWAQVEGSEVDVTIANANSATAEFVTQVVTEAGSATFQVTVTNKYGAQASSRVVVELSQGIIPSITSIVPSHAEPGQRLKISGAGFTNIRGISLATIDGTVDATYSVISDHEIHFITPDVPSGKYQINVLNSGGAASNDLVIGHPFSGVLRVANGTAHVCAIKSDRSLWCWGDNTEGQLGDGSLVSSVSPVVVKDVNGEAVTDVVNVIAGEAFSCAMSIEGKVLCWGNNGSGQLGSGGAQRSSLAVNVALPEKTIAITAGAYFACALLESQEVYCWGANNAGQIGNPMNTGLIPTKIGGSQMSPISAIDAGDNHVCGVTVSDRSVICWGGNEHGQLGDGTVGQKYNPVYAVNGGNRIVNTAVVSSGAGYSCAVTQSGQLVCWGKNDLGQLGIGILADRVDVRYLSIPKNSYITSIFTAQNHSGILGSGAHACAQSIDKEVFCWGKNNTGQLATEGIATSLTPKKIDNLFGVSSLSLGTSNGCAIFSDDQVKCWGQGGETDRRESIGWGVRPIIVEGISDMVAISTGGRGWLEESFSCALSSAGIVSCWGRNDQGQLGVGTLVDSADPVPVSLSSVKAISSGASHTCAVSNKQVYCWGSNTNKGQYQFSVQRTMKLGNDHLDFSSTPQFVSGLPDIASVAVGAQRSCALSEVGDVYCWGQSPADLPEVTAEPIRIGRLPGKAVQIAVGMRESCALLEGGKIYCWFEDFPSQIKMPENMRAQMISVGLDHACGITESGSIYCWGGNGYGQLGNNTTEESRVPVKVRGIDNAISLVAGGAGAFFYSAGFTCALQSHKNGSVSCWGSNVLDQLGDGSGKDQLTPVPIEGLHGIKQISSGGTHSCALYHDGYVACWGGYFGGQLGQSPLLPRAVLQ
jgi:alpha-tubulin suppressor-like RCC1 family protein